MAHREQEDLGQRAAGAAANGTRSAGRTAARQVQKRTMQRRFAARRQKQAQRQAQHLSARLYHAVRQLASNRKLLYSAVALLLAVATLLTTVSSCAMLMENGIQLILTTSYTAEDEDILAVEATYCDMEWQLSVRMADITSEYPGYDAYTVTMDEIGHSPFELASYLTAVYYDYTPSEVSQELNRLFQLQYVIETSVRTETRSGTDENGETYSYEVKILDISLTNTAITLLAMQLLDDEQFEMFNVYQSTKGNKEYLFADYIESSGGSSTTGSYTDYDIPPEALEDAQFAALITEAEKYLGYPYVWGGSSPSTSFDCSGFVCYVLKASGVWNISRTTAQGIYNQCTPVSASEAKPGDLIFFTKTYSTADAVTHVGIYVGNGKMIHCGDPISYADITSSYWQQHFYAFGRY
jgi:cell wall-associated NlpC family hydrolase